MTPTREQVLSEIAREIRFRRAHYPELVALGKLKQEEADERNARLHAGYLWLVNHWPSAPTSPRAA
jgi:hypothetical protein